MVAPAKMNHFVLTKDPTRIQVTSMVLLVFTYVNPADDPARSSPPVVPSISHAAAALVGAVSRTRP